RRSSDLTYETSQAQSAALQHFMDQAQRTIPPNKIAKQFRAAVREEQLADLENLWYRSGNERGEFARQLLHLTERLGEKYQVDELASKYPFTGSTPLTVPEALAIKRELEMIDKLMKQLEE